MICWGSPLISCSLIVRTLEKLPNRLKHQLRKRILAVEFKALLPHLRLTVILIMSQFQIEGGGVVQGVTKLISTFSTFVT